MKRKLLTIAAALMCAMGAWADGYTDYLNTANGYEEVTSTSDLADANYYYVFASAENTSLIIGIADKSDMLPDWYSGAAKILCYKTLSNDPISDATNFFIIQYNEGYEMFNVGYNPNTKFQTHTNKAYLWVNTGHTGSDEYTKFIPSYDGANGYWTFQNNKYPNAENRDANNWYGFLGPWTANYVAEGEHIAGNRTNEGEDLAGHFKIYRIKRTRYEKDVLRNNPVVTDTYLQNPSFELSGSGTSLTADVKQSNGSSLTIYGWTETLGNTDFNNREIISNSTIGSNSNHSAAITAADGSYHFFMRRSWNNGSSKDFTYKSNSATYKAGHYTVTYSYILEEGTSQGNTSTGSYMTLQALEGSTVIGSGRVNAKNWGTTTSYTNTWATSSFSFDLAEEKTLSLAVVITPRGGNKTEAHVDNFIVTYSPFADSDDYAELASAISTAEGYTLGFDAGEYASYNVLPILNAAKAIDPNANNVYSTVRELIEALNAISPNAAEVNAIAYGDLSSYETVGGKDYPWGWSKLNDDSRIMGGSEGTNNAGLSASSTGKAMLVKYNANYGRNEDYLMPLKANTYYTLSFKYCGWGNTPDTRVVIKDSESQALTFTPSSFTPATDDGYSNAAHWYEYKATFKTNDAGNYSIELNKVQSGQKQIAWADMNLVRATVSEIKPLLNSEIVAANATYNSGSNVGEGVFQIPASAGTAFNTAINTTAQGVYDNPSATVDEVVTAIENLKAAEEAYANAELNAPDAEKRYVLTIVEDGEAWNGNAVTFMEGAANSTQGNYGIKYLMPTDVNMAQAVKFTATSGNKYKISYLTRSGNEQYITTAHLGYDAGSDDINKERIRTTDNASKALEIEIQATTTTNQFKLYNTDREAVIGNNGNNDMFTKGDVSFTIAEASKASVSVTISAGKYATRIFPFTPSLPSAIKAYSCAEVDGTTLTLVEEAEPAANTPYILFSEEGYTGDALTGYGTSYETSHTVDLLTGFYNTPTIAANAHHYVLQTKDNGEQAFCIVATDFTNTAPYRAYLTYEAPASVKFLSFDFGNATGIDTVQGSSFKVQDSKIYNLAGQRVDGSRFTVNGSGLKTGIYIVNGKKVLVK